MFPVMRSARTLAVWCVLASMAMAQSPAPSMAPPQADALLRKAVDNEIRAAQDNSARFRYTLSKETNSNRSVREMVETADGIVARTVTWNGRQLTSEERAKEDKRLAM